MLRYAIPSLNLLLALLLCGCHVAPRVGAPELFLKDDGRPFQVSSHHPTEGDAWTVMPGEAKVLMDMQGPAIIRNIWFTLAGGGGPDHGVELLRKVTIRAYWDGEDSPSVEAPFGDFFGSGFGRYTPYISEHIGITSKGYYSYFPMPFRENGRIEIVNGSEHNIIVFFHFLGDRYDSLPDDTLYFHSQWRRDNPTVQGENYTILNATGSGYYAGCHLYMQGYTDLDKLNFLEGDEWVYVDGEEEACIKGTGGEDYFQGAWYFCDGPFQAPYHGLTLRDIPNMQISCYRFHTLDRINFDESIRVEIEHGQRTYNEAKADFSSTAYWYQTEPHAPFSPISDDREPTVTLPGFQIPGAIEFEGTPGSAPYYVCTYNGGWSNDMAGIFRFTKVGDAAEREITVERDGRYAIGANYVVQDHGAILQVAIDGQDIGGPVDTYDADPLDAYLLCRNLAAGLKPLGEIELTKGTHSLTVTVAGKNAASKGHVALIDCVSLVPVD